MNWRNTLGKGALLAGLATGCSSETQKAVPNTELTENEQSLLSSLFDQAENIIYQQGINRERGQEERVNIDRLQQSLRESFSAAPENVRSVFLEGLSHNPDNYLLIEYDDVDYDTRLGAQARAKLIAELGALQNSARSSAGQGR